MQRQGAEVLPVYTVLFSNSTAYGSWKGPVIAPADIRAVIDGIDERGALATLDAVLSGYQGGEGTGAIIVDTVARVKAQNPEALYACDPVMANKETGCFVAPQIPPYIRDHCIPVADIVTPNHFELGFLTELPTNTLEQVLAAADTLLERGPKVVVATGVSTDELAADSTTMVAVTRQGAWMVSTPKINRVFNGAGDVTAATFLVRYLQAKGDVAAALGQTAAVMFGLLSVSAKLEDPELALIEGQDELVNPSKIFEVTSLR